MVDQHMRYEELVLAGWDKTWQGTDPYKLGIAGLLTVVENDLSGENGHKVKFGLSSAIMKTANDNANSDVTERLMELNRELWAVKTYHDFCGIMEKTKTIFETLGKVITH